MSKPKILIQFDTDSHPSVFDAVVAVDADVDHLFRHGNVAESQVRDLVYGAMFTRGPQELNRTALFIGGSDVVAGERLLEAVTNCFFGPMRVSVMLDSNGANTTAAAAVLVARRHVKLQGAQALVLAATGPVGERVVRLLAREGAQVRVASRALDRAEATCARIADAIPDAKLFPHATDTDPHRAVALSGAEIVISAGAPGVTLLSAEERVACKSLRVAVDLSAVPPLGLDGIEMNDDASQRDGAVCYGALGVGALKMKIHKAAIRRLFEQNDLVLDAEEIYALGLSSSRCRAI